MKFITLSEVRKRLKEVVTSLSGGLVITRKGQPAAVLLSIDDYRSMKAMIELAREPEVLAAVQRDHERVQRGDLEGYRTYEEHVEQSGEMEERVAER